MSLDVGGALRVVDRTQVRGAAPSTDPKATRADRVLMQQPKVVAADGVVRLPRTARAERTAALDALLRHYYPVGHGKLRIVSKLDLDGIGRVGRRDEVGKLTKAVLAIPHALSGDFFGSPLTSEGNVRIDTHLAFSHHAKLVRDLLERGCEVFLMVQPGGATEAVYNTDVVTGIADKAVVSSLRWAQRRFEQLAYTGGLQLDRDVPGKGSVEWGDTLQAVRGGKHYLLQGFSSMRGNLDSVERLGRLVHRLNKDGANIVHVPIQLAGEKTLHLDYAANYAGQGATRSMLVAPHAIADQNDIDRMQYIFDVRDGGVLSIPPEDMLHAGANIACPNPGEVFVADNQHCAATAEFLTRRGVFVILSPFHMTLKDGAYHCCIGQLLRL